MRRAFAARSAPRPRRASAGTARSSSTPSPGCARSSCWSRTYASRHAPPAALPPREVRLPLLDVGREPFLGVLTLEELLLQLALDGQRRLEGDLDAGLNGALDPAHGLGRLVRRAELLRVLLHLVHE